MMVMRYLIVVFFAFGAGLLMGDRLNDSAHRADAYTRIMHEKSDADLKRLRMMYRLRDCESGHRPFVVGDRDKPHVALGLYQYQERTFSWLISELRLEGLGLSWRNPEDQEVLTWMALDRGYGYLWSCWDMVQF